MSVITPAERQKYAEIFQARGQMNGYMSGAVARDVLLSSSLPPHRLERIWDLADIDKDGNLDFEEFCIAMHLTFDCINGIEPPLSLPPSLLPPNKAHLQPMHLSQPSFSPQIVPQPTGYNTYQQPPPPPLSAPPQLQQQQSSHRPEFSWDMTHQDMASYQDIYAKYGSATGKVKFSQLEDFYQTLGLTRTELSNAWALVDVNRSHALAQDQCITFLHVLNQCTRGAAIPKSLPPDLHEAFVADNQAEEMISLSSYVKQSNDEKKRNNSTDYRSRSPISKSKGSSYDEERRLRRELEDLKQQIKEAKDRASEPVVDEEKSFASMSFREQLQALYEYKQELLSDQSRVDEKVRQQDRDIEAARDVVRRLNQLVEDIRLKKKEMESILESQRAQIQGVYRMTS
ncbi:endocytosis defective- protein [Apophysomyces ossiformis]|uniref:Endocytosis protein 3 n=1 Tax=Apophysomyces ossiformis TaxID=679940 RepID=A0A8H7BKP6_9FUNG|nr:endocytosis defective- protein [Apophysomyces ossiformis]